MRVVMFGYQTWGHRTLQALLGSGEHEVPLVVTHPRSDHAYERIWSDSVADLAAAHGVPVLERERPEVDDLVPRIAEARPDVIVATNWRTWIPGEIFALPRLGTLNVHDSLLPSYGGFSPLIWALLNDEKQVGVTAHLMDEALDGGAVVAQRAVPVGPRDTTTNLFHRTVALFGPLTLEGLALLADPPPGGFVPQDRSRATFFHKRSDEDVRIDWTWSAAELDRLVRAQCDPYPNAWTYHGERRIRILAARVSQGRYGGTAGRVFIREGDGVVVVAGPRSRGGGEHGLVVERVGLEDGTELAATEYFRTMGGYLTRRPDGIPG